MNHVSQPAAAKPQAPATPPAWLLAAFPLAIFISAFLLFQVQPLISKYILPWFGGSPAVWTTCMLFFQVALFFGYAYAHLTARLLGSQRQAALHVVLLLAALVFLPIIPRASWKPEGQAAPAVTDASATTAEAAAPADPTWQILLLLGATVGMPYFLLSSTGPLLQAWFGRVYPGSSPYRLYALSNVGSLLALLSYPFFFEWMWNSSEQAWMWSGAFVLFAVLCALCGLGLWKWSAPADSHDKGHGGSAVASDQPPTWWQRALWVLLPACASLMLLATTNHVCQEVAVVPFLWVVPLSLYLLSFIIVFDAERWYVRSLFAPLTALWLLFLTAGQYELENWLDPWDVSFSYVHELVFYFGGLFGICMICHGETVRLRPQTKHLTEFYLMLSAGGAIGGVLVSLVAPHVFSRFYEWNIGLTLSFLIAGAVTILAAWQSAARLAPAGRLAIAGTLAAATLVGAGLVAWWQRPTSQPVTIKRNFYGIVYVTRDRQTDTGQEYYQFVSGSTKHGRQWISDDVDKRRLPVSYFAEHTGAGRTLRFKQQQKGNIKAGVVGLGIGTLAAYGNPGDVFRFYEINPEVKLMADDPFTYLRDCRATQEHVIADARLALEQELRGGSHQFDVLLMDAFNGDAPPVHLLTQEAFEIYTRHIRPDGAIVVNIKNRYILLAPVVQKLADAFGLRVTRVTTESKRVELLYRTDFLILTKDEELLKAIPPALEEWAVEQIKDEEQIHPPLWTDQLSNLFQIMKL